MPKNEKGKKHMAKRTHTPRIVACIVLMALVLSTLFASYITATASVDLGASPSINLFDQALDVGTKNYLDSSVAYQLPEGVKDTDELSLIVEMSTESLLDAYDKSGSKLTFTDFYKTEEAAALRAELALEVARMTAKLDKAGIPYEIGQEYDTVIAGFEITAKAMYFEDVCDALDGSADVYVSEVYNAAETKLVDNYVNVQDTGIFDSTGVEYDGTGIVVAVLDTGLDYTHTAFSTQNFTADRSKLGLTFDDIAALVGGTTAADLKPGLTAEDVYINEKVPYGFDYADKDSEVFPILSNHGTHVSGVIAGKDDVITGVAPNAQLVEMKIFSDLEASARASWILAALDDCVVLGVDIINLSIGTSCGFSRETDKEWQSGVYDKIRERGISLVVAASNSFNSTYGSDKNGNLGLTSNPDSATVSSPSTYKSALSVASINGAKTPYLLYGDRIVYFIESTDRVSEEKHFVDELLGDDKTELTIDYVKIPGAGRTADYSGIDVTGKIVLIERGYTTFEEKANVAEKMGAAGVIIYNNVSGDIKMNVGDTKIPVCSISQDDGKILAAAEKGTIKISRNQASGPFMSDFSSWGPSPDLELKPEITAHGGEILSAVPGQDYDRISGTSMATPNVSGLAALLRQYVIERFPELKNDAVTVAAMVNRLLMSTADIIINTNGLPYSVRKQGAGLANLVNAATTDAYILTYDRKDGSLSDKSKIEFGDDPAKLGVYTFKFTIENFGEKDLSYDLSAIVMTEGVSDTRTNQGETTVTQEGYLLNGATVTVDKVSGAGSNNGNTVSVSAGGKLDITMTITLSDADKQYLDESFENGMYVEGFVVLTAKDEGSVNLSIPYLGFYGDWTQAPMFDLDYFETNKDALDDSIDMLDKTLPDAVETIPIGGLYSDYVSYLGSYYFQQNPANKQISADRKYISLSNQTEAINTLRFVWAGLLRNAAKIEIVITEDATGNVIFTKTEEDVRKSYGDGGAIRPANIEIEFAAMEHNLKNNTAYTVTLTGYLDYGDGGIDTNLRNTFVFPLVTDFEAPAVTGCEFYTEYDRSAKKNRLYAKVAVYDNHYAMSMHPGYVTIETDESGEASYTLKPFDKYQTPIFSNANSTNYVVYELTDYINEIKSSAPNKNSFVVTCYDYALNYATYEIALPDDYTDIYFTETKTAEDKINVTVPNGAELKVDLTLSPNQVYDLAAMVYPYTEWAELVEYTCSNPKAAKIVGNKLVAIEPGTATKIYGKINVNGTVKTAEFDLYVLTPDDKDLGYKKYDKPVTESFDITGYYVNKAYYLINSDDRKIGLTGDEMLFANSLSLTMYPSESVTLRYRLNAYFPDATKVVFKAGNENVVTCDENGTIVAVGEGLSSVSVKVYMDDKATYYSHSIDITVEKPYITTGPSLTSYYGNGGLVNIPKTLAITEIGQFAFSNYEFIEKDLAAGDVINEENPESTKMWFIGDNTIEEVIIPEGVERIGAYAFAGLTALKKITLPSTLTMIDKGAFYGCTSLTEVVGIENVKFFNQGAFFDCALTGSISLDSAVAIADQAFAGNKNLKEVSMAASTQSVSAYAFYGNESLSKVTIAAEKIKLGAYAFSGCKALTDIKINASVIPTGAFSGCTVLKNVEIGKDVAVIGENAFAKTAVAAFSVDANNPYLKSSGTLPYLTNPAGTEIVLVAPTVTELNITDAKIVRIGNAAFSGNNNITKVIAPGVTAVGNYAFDGCSKLVTVTLGKLTELGNYAFSGTKIDTLPSLEALKEIGMGAFYKTPVTVVNIPDGVTVGTDAFFDCTSITTITVGNNVTVGDRAFASYVQYEIESYEENGKSVYYYVYKSKVNSLTIGDNVVIGADAFTGLAELTSVKLGAGAVIGDYAFYNAARLTDIDLSKAKSIGYYAFSGDVIYEYGDMNCTNPVLKEDGSYRYIYYAPKFTSIDLSSATKIDYESFAYCVELESVKLGEGVTEIAAGAFRSCFKLANINLESVNTIGNYALSSTALTSADLDSIVEVGEYAFAFAKLESVKLPEEGCVVLEGAFSNCESLTAVSNLDKVTEIGAYGFAASGLKDAKLDSIVKLGDFAFMKLEMSDFAVTLGAGLTEIGENPFAYCRLAPFYITETENFNGKDYYTNVYTYDISDSVKVIDGSIYKVVPNGLVLVTFAGEGKTVTVADKTVRISAGAFIGAEVEKVILPRDLASIGHKAFFECKKLNMVVFQSYYSPILEEEYDYYYYAAAENFAGTGEYDVYNTAGELIYVDGLEIVPYFVWNASSMPSNFYYGANFKNYIGRVENKMLMIAPANGEGYDSFIYSQYFTETLAGADAPDKTTTAAIKAIENLPEPKNITLAHKDLVIAARAAYDKIATDRQRALVTEYQKLTQAEKRISDLEALNQGEGDNTTDEPTEGEAPDLTLVLSIVFGVLAAVAVAAAATFAVLYFKGRGCCDSKANADAKAEKSDEAAGESDENSEEKE